MIFWLSPGEGEIDKMLLKLGQKINVNVRQKIYWILDWTKKKLCYRVFENIENV